MSPSDETEFHSPHQRDDEFVMPSEVKSKLRMGPAGRPIPTDPESMLLPAEAAYCLGVSPRTLEAWRVRGGGPPFSKIGARAVRYQRAAVLAWAANRQRQSTAE
jgi:predicted DNA-binding transcriptional regulator AlpA